MLYPLGRFLRDPPVLVGIDANASSARARFLHPEHGWTPRADVAAEIASPRPMRATDDALRDVPARYEGVWLHVTPLCFTLNRPPPPTVYEFARRFLGPYEKVLALAQQESERRSREAD